MNFFNQDDKESNGLSNNSINRFIETIVTGLSLLFIGGMCYIVYLIL